MSDYISREAAIEAVCRRCKYAFPEDEPCGDCPAKAAIMAVPSADVAEVRHVRRKVWGIDEYYGEWLRCDNCGYEDNTSNAKYCGGCDAKLDLEGE